MHRTVATIRIPFPVKVFLSYLLVVGIGGLPTYFFLRDLFQTQFARGIAENTHTRAVKIAEQLGKLPAPDRVSLLTHIAPALTERITLIEASGRVSFDSTVDARTMGEHSARPEVLQALGKGASTLDFDIGSDGVGVARRFSSTSGVDTLYVALRLSTTGGASPSVLRLATPVAIIERLSGRVLAGFRNSQAIALSAALLLSLIAAAVFMRPLQRLAAAAGALAGGDFHARMEKPSNDEVGDVGRALTRVAGMLRKQAAIAEASEGMITQLVDFLRVPVVVFGSEGRVVAINGAGRVLLGGEENISRLGSSEAFAEVVEAVADNREPLPFELADAGLESEAMGWVQFLRHPTGESLTLFSSDTVRNERESLLPEPSRVRAVQLSTLLADARRFLRQRRAQEGAPSATAEGAEAITVADADGRSGLSLGLLLDGLDYESAEPPPVSVVDDDARTVRVVIPGLPSMDRVAFARLLVAPLGGAVTTEGGVCALELQRA